MQITCTTAGVHPGCVVGERGPRRRRHTTVSDISHISVERQPQLHRSTDGVHANGCVGGAEEEQSPCLLQRQASSYGRDGASSTERCFATAAKNLHETNRANAPHARAISKRGADVSAAHVTSRVPPWESTREGSFGVGVGSTISTTTACCVPRFSQNSYTS